MVKKRSKEQLRNKFLGIEMSLNEIESRPDISLEAPLEVVAAPGDKVQPEQVQAKRNDIPVLFIWVTFLFRVTRIIFSLLGRAFKFTGEKIFGSLLQEVQKTFTYSMSKVSDLKVRGEAYLDEYLSKVEESLDSDTDKVVVESIAIKVESISNNYEKELSDIFHGLNNCVSFSCEKNEYEKVNSSLEFDISLYELMALKLFKTKLSLNVNGIVINSVISQKVVSNSIEFNLKNSGEIWAQLFSKHISPDILSKIDCYQGKVKNQHVMNATLKDEKFIFVFTHQRLDLFMDKAIEERVSRKNQRSERLYSLEVH